MALDPANTMPAATMYMMASGIRSSRTEAGRTVTSALTRNLAAGENSGRDGVVPRGRAQPAGAGPNTPCRLLAWRVAPREHTVWSGGDGGLADSDQVTAMPVRGRDRASAAPHSA